MRRVGSEISSHALLRENLFAELLSVGSMKVDSEMKLSLLVTIFSDMARIFYLYHDNDSDDDDKELNYHAVNLPDLVFLKSLAYDCNKYLQMKPSKIDVNITSLNRLPVLQQLSYWISSQIYQQNCYESDSYKSLQQYFSSDSFFQIISSLNNHEYIAQAILYLRGAILFKSHSSVFTALQSNSYLYLATNGFDYNGCLAAMNDIDINVIPQVDLPRTVTFFDSYQSLQRQSQQREISLSTLPLHSKTLGLLSQQNKLTSEEFLDAIKKWFSDLTRVDNDYSHNSKYVRTVEHLCLFLMFYNDYNVLNDGDSSESEHEIIESIYCHDGEIILPDCLTKNHLERINNIISSDSVKQIPFLLHQFILKIISKNSSYSDFIESLNIVDVLADLRESSQLEHFIMLQSFNLVHSCLITTRQAQHYVLEKTVKVDFEFKHNGFFGYAESGDKILIPLSVAKDKEIQKLRDNIKKFFIGVFSVDACNISDTGNTFIVSITKPSNYFNEQILSTKKDLLINFAKENNSEVSYFGLTDFDISDAASFNKRFYENMLNLSVSCQGVAASFRYTPYLDYSPMSRGNSKYSNILESGQKVLSPSRYKTDISDLLLSRLRKKSINISQFILTKSTPDMDMNILSYLLPEIGYKRGDNNAQLDKFIRELDASRNIIPTLKLKSKEELEIMLQKAVTEDVLPLVKSLIFEIYHRFYKARDDIKEKFKLPLLLAINSCSTSVALFFIKTLQSQGCEISKEAIDTAHSKHNTEVLKAIYLGKNNLTKENKGYIYDKVFANFNRHKVIKHAFYTMQIVTLVLLILSFTNFLPMVIMSNLGYVLLLSLLMTACLKNLNCFSSMIITRFDNYFNKNASDINFDQNQDTASDSSSFVYKSAAMVDMAREEDSFARASNTVTDHEQMPNINHR